MWASSQCVLLIIYQGIRQVADISLECNRKTARKISVLAVRHNFNANAAEAVANEREIYS